MNEEEFKTGSHGQHGVATSTYHTIATGGGSGDTAVKVALRYDTGKTWWRLLPTDGLRALANHYTAGAKKYAERNWELGMDYSRCYDSLMRHLTAWWEGENIDPENGSLHITAVVWNAMALLVYTLRGVGKDDRPILKDNNVVQK